MNKFGVTESIYIKLDYGVSNSIRISDHNGRRKFKYRFNLIESREHKEIHRGNYTRCFYPFTCSSSMIEDIEKHREDTIKKYSKRAYQNFMDKNKRENADAYGFWTKSMLIRSLDDIERILG